MALHLNLYHEIQKQKALQRRDPLKIAGAALALVATGLAGYYLLQLNSLRILGNDVSRLKGEYAALQPKADAAKKRGDEIALTMKLGDTLINRMEGRFYWAPVLAKLLNAVPREVQVRRMSGDVNGESVKRCVLSLEGVAVGADPRKVAEDLRRSLLDEFSASYKSVTSNFRSLEDSEPVIVNGRKVPSAFYGINLVMEVDNPVADPSKADASKQTAKK